MKSLLILILILFFVSCQTTTRQAGESPPSEEEAGDLIAGEGEEEEDLESEFADSEDFEKEMAEESFPSDQEGEEVAKKEPEPTEEIEIDEEDEDLMEIAEDDSSQEEGTTEEEISQTEPADDIEGADDKVLEDESDSSGQVVVQNIRYSAEENKIYIDGTGSFSYQQRENTANNQFVIEIAGAVLAEGLRERPFVMKDFNTDMALLMADQKDSSTVRIVLQMRENASMPSLSEEGGGLVISSLSQGGGGAWGRDGGSSSGGAFEEGPAGVGGDLASGVLPAKSLEDFFLKTPRFTGHPISIHFKDVSVRDVLYFISEGTGLNMVLDDEVSGNISIKLRNVPWDQALITVMKTKKLGYVREGNVIRIMNLESLKKNQKDIQEMLEKQKVLEALKVKVVPLAYAKAGDMQKHAELFLSKESGGKEGAKGGGAQRGQIIVDATNNSLIVVDTEKKIKVIENMVKTLDKAPKQVMIEAKVVEANESFVRDVGISWNYDGRALELTPFNNPNLALNLSGGLEMFSSDSAGGGTSNTSVRLRFAPLGDLDINLGLSEVDGEARVISAPRVMVLSGETATISQSSESLSPKVTATDTSTTTSVERATADLNFKVTPEITSLGSIHMDIDVTRQFFGQRDTVTRARPTFTRTAKTKVLVNNGQTVVIGGIYQYDEQRGDGGFPILRHIPILNWFFSRWTLDRQKNELLLFLTPRVLEFTAQNMAN